MPNLSVRAMADALGLKKSTVGEYKSAGMPMGDAEAARAWVRKSVNVRRADTRSRVGAQADAPAPEAGESKSEALPPVESADFDTAMMRQDAEMVAEARAEVRRAMMAKDAGAFNFALGNYAKLAKELVAARLRWMDSQERAGKLLNLDECLAAVAGESAEVRRALTKLGDRVAALANPSDPALAKRVIDEAVDAAFAGFSVQPHALAKAFSPKEAA